MQGDQEAALQFLSKALAGLDIPADEVMADRAFAKVHAQRLKFRVTAPNSV
jgi:hypothetical protein